MEGTEGRKFASGGGLGGSTEGTIDFRPLCRCKSVDMAQAFGFALQNFTGGRTVWRGWPLPFVSNSWIFVGVSPDRLQVICAIWKSSRFPCWQGWWWLFKNLLSYLFTVILENLRIELMRWMVNFYLLYSEKLRWLEIILYI